MSGEQFLYTQWALGLSPELIARIRKLVTGKGVISQGQRIRFKDMGIAADEFRASSSQRLRWGPSVGVDFAALIERLEREMPRRNVTGEHPAVE